MKCLRLQMTRMEFEVTCIAARKLSLKNNLKKALWVMLVFRSWSLQYQAYKSFYNEEYFSFTFDGRGLSTLPSQSKKLSRFKWESRESNKARTEWLNLDRLWVWSKKLLQCCHKLAMSWEFWQFWIRIAPN